MSRSIDFLPSDFVERMRGIIPPPTWDEFLESFQLPRRAALRLNPLRNSPELTRQRIEEAGIALTPQLWSPHSFSFPAELRSRVSHLPESGEGLFYMQSLSSQLAAVLLGPRPGDQVLDLAAAPGGKAAHLAAIMENQGLLSCVEPIRSRFFRLHANLKTQGVTIAKFYQTDGRTVGKKVGERFDRVLLDAPCSSEARFSVHDPDSTKTWSPRKIRETSRKQSGLILSAFDALKPGGRLLYSTCSFAPEENEGVVAVLLKKRSDMVEVLPATLDGHQLNQFDIPALPGLVTYAGEDLPSSLLNTVRILPNAQFEGFYLALLGKKE